MRKLIIFDLDGTLLDTIDGLQKALNMTCVELGHPEYSRAETMAMVGHGMRNLVADALGYRNEESYQLFLKNYESCFVEYSYPYEGIREVLSVLKNKGYLLSVNSNKDDALTKELVSHYFGEFDFDMALGRKDGCPIKPDPYGCVKIMETLGVSADESVYIGDSDVDVKTAENAGLKFVGCDWGFRGAEALKKAGATLIAMTPADLPDLL